ncbi:MAG: TetR/AcrR family transcriptional regulator [Pseudomonadota bacterium]
MNQGLRQRQKASRRARILDVAREKFQNIGFAKVKIEDIAAESDVSPATVYNYFGTKAGILLALVGESDTILIEQLDELTESWGDDLTPAVLEFGRILRKHAMSYLQKPTWREVLAASIHDGSGDFGQTYMALDDVLVGKMEGLIKSLQQKGRVSQDVDPAELADCLFSLQNIRFFQFIANDSISLEDADARFQQDLEQLSVLFANR